MAKAYLVGSGIAALAAATFLIRDGGFDGADIHLFEERRNIGGSLDAGGTADAGHTNSASSRPRSTRAITISTSWPPLWRPCIADSPEHDQPHAGGALGAALVQG